MMKAAGDGERRLLWAILLDAIVCWQSNCGYTSGERARLYGRADFWIFGQYYNPPFFSFVQTCECLRLDSDFIRRGLLDWRRRQPPSDEENVQVSAISGQPKVERFRNLADG